MSLGAPGVRPKNGQVDLQVENYVADNRSALMKRTKDDLSAGGWTEKGSSSRGDKSGSLKELSDNIRENTSVTDKIRGNSWFKLLVYCIACLTTSCLYFGWQAYGNLLIKSGAYSWRCTAASEPTTDADDPALCLEQSKSVSRLYAMANGSEFAFAAVAGVMLDSFGPKITATCGEMLQFLSIILLIVAGKKFQIYPLAMVMTGACVNIISFPALTVMEQWPNHQAFAVSVIVGCQSVASIVAPIMEKILDLHPGLTFKHLWGYWLLFIWLPVTTLYIWTLPRSRDYHALLVNTIVIPENASDQKIINTEGKRIPQLETTFCNVKHDGSFCDIKCEPKSRPIRNGFGDLEANMSINGGSKGLVTGGNQDPALPTKGSVVSHTFVDSKNDDGGTLESKSKGWGQWREFFKCLKTFDIWMMAIFCACLMFQFAYYPAVVRDAVGMEISEMIGWLTPLQGPFSFIIGFLMDYSGTTLIMMIMGLSLIFVNLACGLGSDIIPLSKTVAIWFIFVQSATYNVKYTFVNEMYDPFNFGKLVGVLGIAGGIGVYCSNPLVELTNYKTIFIALTAVAVLMIIQTVIIFYRQWNGITHKTIKPVTQKYGSI